MINYLIPSKKKFLKNYIFLGFLFIKLSSEHFLSFSIISKIILVFVFSVLVMTAFYKEILRSQYFHDNSNITMVNLSNVFHNNVTNNITYTYTR
jgi:hypothetical protein